MFSVAKNPLSQSIPQRAFGKNSNSPNLSVSLMSSE